MVSKEEILKLKAENAALRDSCKTLQHWARRYCDERRTYVTSWFNDITRYLLKLGIDLETCDGIIWARDGDGRGCDKLSEAEATPNTPEALGKNFIDKAAK